METNKTLKKFMLENFDFTGLRKAGFFTSEMKGDYEAQAARVCQFFGLKSIYDYGMHIDEKGALNEGLSCNPAVYRK
jgi:hypothetical protein